MNESVCLDGHSDLIFGTPAAFTLSITVPPIFIGIIMNAFVLLLLMKQKRPMTNQDVYVMTLAIFGWIMIGPCFAFTVYANWMNCYTAPQLVTDVRIFLSQLCAGMNIWIVFFISLDRLLMVVYSDRYVQRETRTVVLSKLTFTFVFYAVVCGCINFSAYFLNDTRICILSPNPKYAMVFSFKAWPNYLSKSLNVLRMFTDRIIPYILCITTQCLVLVLRKRHKMAIQPDNVEPQATLKKIRAEERYRRSKRLVIGVSVTLFIFLGPETVMDVSEYAFGHALREGPYRIIGVLWYLQNVSNPAIYILAIPTLRLAARRMLKKVFVRLGCIKDGGQVYSARDSVRTVFGTSVQLQRTAF